MVIPALNRGHFKNIPYDFCLAGLIFSLPLITIGAANAFGWMLAYLRGAIRDRRLDHFAIAGNDPHLIMLLLVLLFTVVGDFIEPVPTIIIFMPLVNTLTAGRRYQRRAYGRRADRDIGFRPDHAALRAGAVDGVEIRRRPVFQGVTGGAADLCRVPADHHVYDLFPEGRAVAAEAGDLRNWAGCFKSPCGTGYICPN